MQLNGYGQPMMDVVLNFFKNENWQYQQLETKNTIRTGYRGERGTWVCYARVDERYYRFIFYVQTGMCIPEQYRNLVAEYLNRVNYCLLLGNFEMDMDTGNVRFRASVEIPDGILTEGMVRSMVYTSVHNLDQYLPGLMAVVHGGLSPAAALARQEAMLAG
jgi:hypothetical protein